MQTRVPDEQAEWIEKEAARRDKDCPEFFREVIAAGIESLRSSGGS
jgi:hypothetical protein